MYIQISSLLSHLALNKLLLVGRNHQADCTEETIAATVNELQQVLYMSNKMKTPFLTIQIQFNPSINIYIYTDS